MDIQEAWRINALRTGNLNDSLHGELLSLKGIINMKAQERPDKVNELYIMLKDDFEINQRPDDMTLIVKREKLVFNDKECQVLNF